jgi:hypothetical protein
MSHYAFLCTEVKLLRFECAEKKKRIEDLIVTCKELNHKKNLYFDHGCKLNAEIEQLKKFNDTLIKINSEKIAKVDAIASAIGELRRLAEDETWDDLVAKQIMREAALIVERSMK